MSDHSRAPQELGFDGNDTVHLANSVSAYGEQLDKLVFRPPIGKDARACGFPFIFTPDGDMKVDALSVCKLAERLAGVPASSIDALSMQDWTAVQQAVLHFFGRTESQPILSIDTTTSHGDGVEILSPSSRSRSENSSSLNDRRSA